MSFEAGFQCGEKGGILYVMWERVPEAGGRAAGGSRSNMVRRAVWKVSWLEEVDLRLQVGIVL